MNRRFRYSLTALVVLSISRSALRSEAATRFRRRADATATPTRTPTKPPTPTSTRVPTRTATVSATATTTKTRTPVPVASRRRRAPRPILRLPTRRTATRTTTSSATVTATRTFTAAVVPRRLQPRRRGRPWSPPTDGGPSIGGCPVFPGDNVWNRRVDTLPVDPSSQAYVTNIGATTGMHADFGVGPVGRRPDRHPVRHRRRHAAVRAHRLHLVRRRKRSGAVPGAGQRAHRGRGCQHRRPPRARGRQGQSACSTSCTTPGHRPTAAGRPARAPSSTSCRTPCDPRGGRQPTRPGFAIMPGLVRYDEVAAGAINHALRFTVPRTRQAYLWPARHQASSSTDLTRPPMGQRFRLKATFDISAFSPANQVILTGAQDLRHVHRRQRLLLVPERSPGRPVGQRRPAQPADPCPRLRLRGRGRVVADDRPQLGAGALEGETTESQEDHQETRDSEKNRFLCFYECGRDRRIPSDRDLECDFTEQGFRHVRSPLSGAPPVSDADQSHPPPASGGRPARSSRPA